MASRPAFIDVPPPSPDPGRPGARSPRGLGSPRPAHADGDIAPALSPLDAFAAQGRMLAKQLDDSNRDGRRVSRLPPLTIASSLAQSRPGYLRSASSDNVALPDQPRQAADDTGLATKTAVETPDMRPKSVHPRLSGMPAEDPDTALHYAILAAAERDRGRQPSIPSMPDRPIFAPRTESPQRFGGIRSQSANRESVSHIRQKKSVDSTHALEGGQRSLANELAKSRVYNPHSLAPPRFGHRRNGSSIRSVAVDSDDDDAHGSTASLPRKLSSGSGLSVSSPPRSPLIPPPPPRSPSISSEYSVGGTRQPRGTLNFSRPLSRASRPSLDMPSRQQSSDSQPYVLNDDSVHTPVSLNSDENETADPFQQPVPSYIYSSYSLPRGRTLHKDPGVFHDGQTHEQHHFQWQQPPVPFSNVRPATPNMDETPLSPRSASHDGFPPPALHSTPEQNALPRRSPPRVRESPRPSVDHMDRPSNSLDIPRSSAERSRRPHASVSSSNTIKPQAPRKAAASGDISAEDHLARGIECHERGSVNESTYHLRIAAKANHPTAMLLYALACRHGWGMRPNPKEGVQWLRKAADSAGLEVADDEDNVKEAKPGDAHERKTRQAQFALSIYELGVSHMNGWGIEQDKALALRCFEIAGGKWFVSMRARTQD